MLASLSSNLRKICFKFRIILLRLWLNFITKEEMIGTKCCRKWRNNNFMNTTSLYVELKWSLCPVNWALTLFSTNLRSHNSLPLVILSLGRLSKRRSFEPQTTTGSELFSNLTCFHTTKFILYQFENLGETTVLARQIFSSGFHPWLKNVHRLSPLLVYSFPLFVAPTPPLNQ